jgi:hypothetical protein
MVKNKTSVEELRHRSAGEDPEDPYENIDLETLPDWWQSAVEEFQKYGLRPYRPSQFSDGELKQEVVDRIEEEFDVTIRFLCSVPDNRDEWEVHIGSEMVMKIGHHRTPEGYSVYEVTSSEFEEHIYSKLDQSL